MRMHCRNNNEHCWPSTQSVCILHRRRRRSVLQTSTVSTDARVCKNCKTRSIVISKGYERNKRLNRIEKKALTMRHAVSLLLDLFCLYWLLKKRIQSALDYMRQYRHTPSERTCWYEASVFRKTWWMCVCSTLPYDCLHFCFLIARLTQSAWCC